MVTLTLRPFGNADSGDRFLLYEGPETCKMVDGLYTRVAPFSFLRLVRKFKGRGHNLSYSIGYGLDLGSRRIISPKPDQCLGHLTRRYRKKTLFSDSAESFIHSYKLVNLLGLLTRITAKDTSSFGAVGDMYSNYLINGEECFEPVEKRTGILRRKTKVWPNIPRKFDGVDIDELRRALESKPSIFQGVKKNEKIDVVLMGNVRIHAV